MHCSTRKSFLKFHVVSSLDQDLSGTTALVDSGGTLLTECSLIPFGAASGVDDESLITTPTDSTNGFP